MVSRLPCSSLNKAWLSWEPVVCVHLVLIFPGLQGHSAHRLAAEFLLFLAGLVMARSSSLSLVSAVNACAAFGPTRCGRAGHLQGSCFPCAAVCGEFAFPAIPQD